MRVSARKSRGERENGLKADHVASMEREGWSSVRRVAGT